MALSTKDPAISVNKTTTTNSGSLGINSLVMTKDPAMSVNATDTSSTPMVQSVPSTQTATVPSPQPTASDKNFYRIGKDIYEAGTNRYIGATEWGNSWSGQSSEVVAPTEPIIEPATPSEITQENPVVATTDSFRKDIATTQQDATNLSAQVDNLSTISSPDYTPFTQTTEGANAEGKISAAETAIAQVRAGAYTDTQKSQIESAILRAQSQYEPMVKEAENAKASGLPKAEVLAGQLGGFLNTQFAGIAALLPTAGGNFIGSGGELERISSAYDTNIANAKSAMNAAIENARASAIQAIDSGLQSDLTNAQNAYDRAYSAHAETLALARQKQEDLINWAVKSKELQQYERTDVSTTIDAFVGAGYEESDIPDWYFEDLDTKGGYTQGVSKAMFATQKASASAKSQTDYLDAMTKLMDVTAKLSPTQYIDFGDQRYYGTKSNFEFQGTEIDKATGNVTAIWSDMSDPSNPKITTSTKYGLLTPNVSYQIKEINGDYWYIPDDPNAGPAIPVTGSTDGGAQGVNSGALEQVFPEGMKYDSTTSAQGYTKEDFWCLRWAANLDVRGQSLMNEIGDSISSKRASVEQNIGFGTGQTPPQAGDYILTNEDSTYGHIALITEIRTDPATGKTVAVLSESNYKPLTVTHSRTIELDSANLESSGGSILGFKKAQLINALSSQSTVQLGTDVDTTGQLISNDIFNQQVNSIESVKNSPAFHNAVGPGKLSRMSFLGIGQSDVNTIISKLDQVTAQKTLDTLISTKSQGGTLGALSDQERVMLQNAATRINGFKHNVSNDPNKRVQGYRIKEDDFMDALNELESSIVRLNAYNNGKTSLMVEDLSNSDPNTNKGYLTTQEFDSSKYKLIE
jgi:hypothetical protein